MQAPKARDVDFPVSCNVGAKPGSLSQESSDRLHQRFMSSVNL